MKNDYMYCLNEGSCFHRKGCRRWIGNYTDQEACDEATANRFAIYIDDVDCMNKNGFFDVETLEDGTEWYPTFRFLDRFRLSDGSEIK